MAASVGILLPEPIITVSIRLVESLIFPPSVPSNSTIALLVELTGPATYRMGSSMNVIGTVYISYVPSTNLKAYDSCLVPGEKSHVDITSDKLND